MKTQLLAAALLALGTTLAPAITIQPPLVASFAGNAAIPDNNASGTAFAFNLSTPNPAVKGAVKYWQTTYDDINVPSAKFHDDFLAAMKTALPNVTLTEEQGAYGDFLGKIRQRSAPTKCRTWRRFN